MRTFFSWLFLSILALTLSWSILYMGLASGFVPKIPIKPCADEAVRPCIDVGLVKQSGLQAGINPYFVLGMVAVGAAALTVGILSPLMRHQRDTRLMAASVLPLVTFTLVIERFGTRLILMLVAICLLSVIGVLLGRTMNRRLIQRE